MLLTCWDGPEPRAVLFHFRGGTECGDCTEVQVPAALAPYSCRMRKRSDDPDRPRYWIAVLILAVAAAGMFALSNMPGCVGPNAPDCVARKEARKTCAEKSHRAPGQSEEECVYSQS
jgi:hypothetical protein